jgi:hypothetical protein
MFNQILKKYLPIIAILMKRTANGEQQSLKMNQLDFARAAGGRKIKFNFNNLHLINGKINYTLKITPLATELALLLQSDATINGLLKLQSFEFSMGNDFMLLIKNNTNVVEAVEEETAVAELND